MKKVFFASGFALVLAACGGGGDKEAQLTKACVGQGDGSQAECECMSKAAVESLDDNMVDLLIKTAKKGDQADEAMAEAMNDLSVKDKTQLGAFMMNMMMTCSGS